MASDVSVERAAISGGIGCCKTSIHELQSAASSLKSDYGKAGQGWKDQKYAALGGIVDECCSALTNPISELQECIGTLQDLLNSITDYESVNL